MPKGAKGTPKFVLKDNQFAEVFLATFVSSGQGTVIYRRNVSTGGGTNPGTDPGTNPGGGTSPIIVSNLNFSAPELTEYSKRFRQQNTTGQNYYAFGEGGTNFPGDGLKLRQQTDAFIADENWDATNSYLTKYFWTGPERFNTNGSVQTLNEVPAPKDVNVKDNEPNYSQTSSAVVSADGSGITLYKASVRYLIDSDLSEPVKTALVNKIIKQIIAFASASYLDFRNATLYPTNKYNDVNPIFLIEGLFTRLKRTWENVKSKATDAQKTKVDTWFFWFYRYMQDYNNEFFLDGLFESRTGVRGWAGRVQCDQEEYYNLRDSGKDNYNNTYTHRGGYNVTSLVMMASNRRTTNICATGIAACSFKQGHYIDYTLCYRYLSSAPNTPISGTQLTSLAQVNATIQRMYDSAFMYFKEAIRFGFYPDGTCGELYRAGATSTEQGMNYFCVSLGAMIMYADVMARAGDRRPYNFVTSYGRDLTLGGPKSIWTIAKNFADHYSHQIIRYAQGTSGTDNNLIQDGIQLSPLSYRHYCFDNILAPLVLFGRLTGKDSALMDYLTAVMKRNRTAYPALSNYPASGSISKIGDFDGSEGSFCNMPGGFQQRYFDMHPKVTVNEVYPLAA